MNMTVTLKAYREKLQRIRVESIAEARRVQHDWIAEHCYGSRDLDGPCGVITVAGIALARLSFNGRLWALQPGAEGQIELSDDFIKKVHA